MPASDLSHELEVATAAARAAGVIQVERYERLERIVHKSEKDVVTEVDHLSEEAILAAIGKAFPGDAFLAEESGVSGPKVSRVWVIDPLDGTVNYANGIPFFAVSIGLVIDAEPVLGVVLDPLRDELFSATRGGGAFLDGTAIRIPGKERLIDAVVHLGLPRSGFERQNSAYRKAVRITRQMGSSTLGLTYVANGRFDAYVQWQGLSPWDICAAGVIAREGGAVITSQVGDSWFDVGMTTRSIGIVAAAPEHHAAYLGMLSEAG
ncbi:MAG: inositol monophosphatase [Chloroflexota bacterium]